jgi:hypothetical protein
LEAVADILRRSEVTGLFGYPVEEVEQFILTKATIDNPPGQEL